MIEVALVLGFPRSLPVAAALALRLLPSLRLQLAALAVLGCPAPGVVLASGWVMFHMHDNVKILTVSVASAWRPSSALSPARSLDHSATRAASRDIGSGSRRATSEREFGHRVLGARRAGSSLNEMAKSIEQLLDARGELVARAATTPDAARLASRDGRSSQDGIAASDVYSRRYGAGRDLSRLVDDLLKVACINAGVLTLQLSDAPLDDLVQGCLRAVDAEARARNVDLEARVDPSDPIVPWLPKRSSGCSRTCSDALRHTPSKGRERNRRADTEHGSWRRGHRGGVDFGCGEPNFDRFWRDDDSAPATGVLGSGSRSLKGSSRRRVGVSGPNRATVGMRVAFTLPLAHRGVGTRSLGDSRV